MCKLDILSGGEIISEIERKISLSRIPVTMASISSSNPYSMSIGSKSSISFSDFPHNPQPLESSVLLELGEFVLQQSNSLAERGICSNELNTILTSVKLGAKVVNRILTRQGSFGVDAIGCKLEGEDIADLRLKANRTFIEAVKNRQGAAGLVSSVDQAIIQCEGCEDRSLVVLLSPLDGTKQIDVNVSSGTLFSIYKRISPLGGPVESKDFLQAGGKQVCAGYVLYGSSTIFVCTMGGGVHGFTLNPSLGTFYLSHMNIRIPEKGDIYSVNGGKYAKLPLGARQYISHCQDKSFSCRYIGSLVADFHRNMLKGGIYMHPLIISDPFPSVSMAFQCLPLAFIAEEAGGVASDGYTRIQLIEPVSFQDRIAFFCGSSHLVGVLNLYMAKHKIRDGGWCFKTNKQLEEK